MHSQGIYGSVSKRLDGYAERNSEGHDKREEEVQCTAKEYVAAYLKE